MKKNVVLFSIVLSLFVLLLTGCGTKEITGSLEDIMDKLYVNIPEDQRPMMLMNVEITEENIEMYLGTSNIEYEEAIVSESATGSIPHSVALIRVKNSADVEKIKETIEQKVNPRKWICVEAEEVEVENRGNLILLVMSSEENAEKITDAFDNL